MTPADPYADRIGDYIITYSGARFYPLDFRASDINVADIAHHLSQANRFRGALAKPVSVAQHSVFVSLIAEATAEPDYKVHAAWQGLLHDASEAYFGDTPRPFKRCAGLIDKLVERDEALQTLIYRKYGCYYPAMLPAVKHVDDLMMQFEARELSGPMYEAIRREDLSLAQNPEAGEVLRPWYPWPAHVAEARFLYRFEQLRYNLPFCKRCKSYGFSPVSGGCDLCCSTVGGVVL